jgi:membrane protein implicated in regulation of membrane protease activity
VNSLTFWSALQIAIPTDPTQLLILLLVIVIIGIIIIAVIGFLIAFPIAALAAILVWVLTGGLSGGGDLFLTAVTFLVVALVSAIIGRVWRASSRTGHSHKHTHEHEHEHEHVD